MAMGDGASDRHANWRNLDLDKAGSLKYPKFSILASSVAKQGSVAKH